MLKSCMLVFLLCGCYPADHYMARFSQEQSDRNFRAMEYCANAVAEIPLPLDDEAKNAIYSDCLIQVGATI